MNDVARLEAVTHHFPGHTALHGVDVGVREGAITGLLGRNGAGKTTMLRLLAGHIAPSAGRVEVFGRAPWENEAVLDGVCLVREDQRYPDTFRVRHVLRAAGRLHPRWDEDHAQALVDEFALPRDRPVKGLSRGMRSALGVVVGLASRAPLTCFDEPYLGLDAVARQRFYDLLLADYAEHPRTIVLSTHLIDEVSDLLERVLVVDAGRVVMDDDAETIRGRAVTVTGPEDAVDAFVVSHTVLHREQLGGVARATVSSSVGATARADATGRGLEVEPVSLQELVVRTTAPSPAVGTPSTSSPTEQPGKVTR